MSEVIEANESPPLVVIHEQPFAVHTDRSLAYDDPTEAGKTWWLPGGKDDRILGIGRQVVATNGELVLQARTITGLDDYLEPRLEVNRHIPRFDRAVMDRIRIRHYKRLVEKGSNHLACQTELTQIMQGHTADLVDYYAPNTKVTSDFASYSQLVKNGLGQRIVGPHSRSAWNFLLDRELTGMYKSMGHGSIEAKIDTDSKPARSDYVNAFFVVESNPVPLGQDENETEDVNIARTWYGFNTWTMNAMWAYLGTIRKYGMAASHDVAIHAATNKRAL